LVLDRDLKLELLNLPHQQNPLKTQKNLHQNLKNLWKVKSLYQRLWVLNQDLKRV